ncbi:flagellar basal body P-ring formation chaperone FlgA [Trinickia sp.]|uniref:flagellar basal body P-ring formation chaperone FlgA n=1 Tax=Trinickia sp. TaxID=2571163 RepID=UPI003F80C795
MPLSAESDPARQMAPRALGRRHVRGARRLGAAACALVAAFLLPCAAARAQNAGAGGQIYIPGPGEAHAAQPSGMISIPGPGEAQAAKPSGMISIPGPGEAQAAAANRTMPVVVTAPQRVARAAQPIAVEQPATATFTRVSARVPSAVGAAQSAPTLPAAAASALRAATTAAPASPAPTATATAAAAAPASNAPAGQEDGETIRRAALAFLQQQTVGLPGKIEITVAPTFPRGLAACNGLEPFMPTGARLWGTTTVGVRCAGAKPWTLYLRARIAIEATYYLAARQIEPGTVVTAQDLLARNGDLSNLPRAIITDPSQAVGASAIVRISAGMPLRQDLLKSASAVIIGQTVRVVAQGQGFTISAEGSVMNNASPGQQVRVKMAGGQIISGIVRDGGTVEVQM